MDVLPSSNYRAKLVGLGTLQKNLTDLSDTIHKCAEFARRARGPGLAVVLTKPPESVMCLIQYTTKGKGSFFVFDSHKRPIHEGAAILEFDDVGAMATYLQ